MNREIFESLVGRAKEFGDRSQLGEDVRVEIWLVTGRSFLLEKVVEAGDSVVQFDVRDPIEDQPGSCVMPYHQISHIVLSRRKPSSRGAGFNA